MSHTPGPWTIKKAIEPSDGGYDYAVLADGECIAEAFEVTSETNRENAQDNAALIVRLANLYFSGTSISEQRTADVIEQGDLPADPGYGLTENEIAAAHMMNALMAENTEMLKALEHIKKLSPANAEPPKDNRVCPPPEITIALIAQFAIEKAKGEK